MDTTLLSQIRTDMQTLGFGLPDSCVITHTGRVSDNEGGFTEGTPSTAGPFPCRYRVERALLGEYPRGGQEASTVQPTVTFAANTDVRGTDKITLTQAGTGTVLTLFVKDVLKSSEEFIRKVICDNLNP